MPTSSPRRPSGFETVPGGPHFPQQGVPDSPSRTVNVLTRGRVRPKRSPAQPSVTVTPPARRSFLNQAVQDLRTGLPLLLADCLGLVLSLKLASLCLYAFVAGQPAVSMLSSQAAVSCSAYVVLYLLLGLYPGVGLNPIVELKKFSLGTATATLILLVTAATQGNHLVVRLTTIAAVGLWASFLVPVFRATAREFLGRCDWWGQRALIIGAGKCGRKLYHALQRKPGTGLKPVGILEDPHLDFEDADETPGLLGPVSKVSRIAAEHNVRWALIAMPDRSRASTIQVLERCSFLPHVILIPGFEELPSLWNQSQDLGGVMGIHVRERLLSPSAQILKRVLDIVAVVLGCIVLFPVFFPLLALMCIFIKVVSPGPIFFGQERIGKDGRRFRAWKFRTMVQDADRVLQQYLEHNPQLQREWDQNQKLRHDPRVLPVVGGFLRKTSLDELPQLWNVLVGEMSLVGPRPFMTEQTKMYGDAYRLYCQMQPGITGLWQISGRNHTTFKERASFDVYYVRNWSLWLDLFILGRTIKTVIFSEGAY